MEMIRKYTYKNVSPINISLLICYLTLFSVKAI